MSKLDDKTVEFDTALSTFTSSINAAMEAALVCSNLAITQYVEHDNLNWCQRFLDAMPKNFSRRSAFLTWLASHSPITIEDGKLKKDKSDNAVKFNLEAALAKPFWDFAPDKEDVVLTDADAFKRLMVAVKYFRRDNVKSSDRITALVNGIEVLVDNAKSNADKPKDGTDAALDALPVEKEAAVA